MLKIGYKQIVPIFLGAVLGYAYYYFIGCNSGSCAITSSPYISTIYGAVVGLVFAIPSKKKNEKTESN